MARTLRNQKIDTRSARVKLAVRREPYWTVVSQGKAVGYRKGTKGGTWIARWRREDGTQKYEALGAADDSLDPNGLSILSFGQAQEKARDWFAECEKPELPKPPEPYTINTAAHDYLSAYRAGANERRGEGRC